MLTQNLGYPRIGTERDLKKIIESYWKGDCSKKELVESTSALKKLHWTKQKEAGIDLVPSNDFSLYDQVLDTALLVGAIPERYKEIYQQEESFGGYPMDAYFAMARGLQNEQYDIAAMEMTKWFNTNYHYIVPEFTPDQEFSSLSTKIFDEYDEAGSAGVVTKPVLIGPVSFLMLGKEKQASDDFHRLDLLERLLPVYQQILQRLREMGVEWVQVDEPFLALDMDKRTEEAFKQAYQLFSDEVNGLNLILTTYFEGLSEQAELACDLPVAALHVDLVDAPDQLAEILDRFHGDRMLSLGLVNGRNIWKTDLRAAMSLIQQAEQRLGGDRLILAPSCSMLHCPVDLEWECDETTLPKEVKQWMAFADQKLDELSLLKRHSDGTMDDEGRERFERHQRSLSTKRNSPLVHHASVQRRMENLDSSYLQRKSGFDVRKKAQRTNLNIPERFPCTTIGSFPQTREVRVWRADARYGRISREEYERKIKQAIRELVAKQEEIGLDVLVHGEFERNDMVEYFGEHFSGIAFTRNGWVQSYGTRGVKPPVIYGDVFRTAPVTVPWISYAQSLTPRPVKGMLTGPVTILQWSFVRDDQPRSETAKQIALAIRDEVKDLEESGIGIIQIDEPAFREGLPLRKRDRDNYLGWAVDAFRIASTCVEDKTQIHSHMCYSEFNDIIEHIARLDADVISMETSRSQLELLEAFVEFDYPNEIGPGVYDIHSPRVPSVEEMTMLLVRAADVLGEEKVWVNPDCGLKTRGWEETIRSLENMVQAAQRMREVRHSSF